jgi:hypothetical protein
MKLKWLKALKCGKCGREFGKYDVKNCIRCGTQIGLVPVVAEAPPGRYLMRFCTCTKKAPLTTLDSDGHLHLRLLTQDHSNTFHGGEA